MLDENKANWIKHNIKIELDALARRGIRPPKNVTMNDIFNLGISDKQFGDVITLGDIKNFTLNAVAHANDMMRQGDEQ